MRRRHRDGVDEVGFRRGVRAEADGGRRPKAARAPGAGARGERRRRAWRWSGHGGAQEEEAAVGTRASWRCTVVKRGPTRRASVSVAARVSSARQGDEQRQRMREASRSGGRGRPAAEDKRGR
jgi:hypothetical protein